MAQSILSTNPIIIKVEDSVNSNDVTVLDDVGRLFKTIELPLANSVPSVSREVRKGLVQAIPIQELKEVSCNSEILLIENSESIIASDDQCYTSPSNLQMAMDLERVVELHEHILTIKNQVNSVEISNSLLECEQNLQLELDHGPDEFNKRALLNNKKEDMLDSALLKRFIRYPTQSVHVKCNAPPDWLSNFKPNRYLFVKLEKLNLEMMQQIFKDLRSSNLENLSERDTHTDAVVNAPEDEQHFMKRSLRSATLKRVSDTNQHLPYLRTVNNIKEEKHKELIISLERINSRIINKLTKYNSVKASSTLLGNLFHRNVAWHKARRAPKKVIYDKNVVDRRFIFNVYRRGGTIVDKSGLLKYKCPTCPYKSWSVRSLSKHHTGLHGFRLPNILKCPDCDYATCQQSALKRHKEKHKLEPDQYCPHCPFKSRFECGLRIHLRRWHLSDDEAKAWKCHECNFTSISSTTYKAHLAVHLTGMAALNDARFVKKSVSGNVTRQIIKCDYCRYEAPHKNALRNHMQITHKIENPFARELYRCKLCLFMTKYQHSLRQHILSCHKSKEETQSYNCYHCEYCTKNRKYLITHLRKHKTDITGKEPMFSHCNLCNKQIRKENLRAHISKVHLQNVAGYHCYICNYSYKWKPALRRHIIDKHLNRKAKVYNCRICAFTSICLEEYMRHRSTSHKLHCDMCGFATKSKSTLRYHIIGHMDKKRQEQALVMFRCQACDYESRNKQHFERHLDRRKHSYVGVL